MAHKLYKETNEKNKKSGHEWTTLVGNCYLIYIFGFLPLIMRDGFFDIYDWKRSNKVLDSSGNPIVHNGYGQTGKDKYRNIQDTPYWHYCLQQNLYRYILQTKYNIRVGKMYLVVYSEMQNSYKKLEVPYMDDVIAMVINDCKNGTLTGMS